MTLDSLNGAAVQEIEHLMLLSTNSRLTVPWCLPIFRSQAKTLSGKSNVSTFFQLKSLCNNIDLTMLFNRSRSTQDHGLYMMGQSP